MKARAPQRDATTEGGPPLELQAGACFEIWSPDAGNWKEARRRYKEARRRWHADHGVTDTAELGETLPWSYNYILSEHGPEQLQRRLASRGLPLDWTPVPVSEA
jgi:hypothetical protein